MLTIAQIRGLRLTAGITQKDFAEVMEVPQGTWSNVEIGNHPLYAEHASKAENIFKELGILKEGMTVPIADPKKTRWARADYFNKPVKVEKVELPTEPLTYVGEAKAVVEGVGKDAPTITNEKGGAQSAVQYRFDLLDPLAMFAMCKVLKEGADKYGENNWHNIDVNDNLNHLIIHVFAYLTGDKQDDHLAHALCRAMFALGNKLREEQQGE